MWVAVENDRPVSLSGFNATLPDIVQLGRFIRHPTLGGVDLQRWQLQDHLLLRLSGEYLDPFCSRIIPVRRAATKPLGSGGVGDYGLVLLK